MGGKKSNDLKQLIPRGFLSSYILFFLRDEPLHGYGIMKKIKEKTKFWEPSPGAVYPALHSLVEKGFIKELREGRKKKYILTKKGLKISEEIKDFKETMKNKMVNILGSILNVKREELEKIFEKGKEECKSGPLSMHLRCMFKLLFKISDDPVKCLKAAKEIEETNQRLRKIVNMRA